MKIRLVSLKRSSEDTEKIRQLYESAFPENERAPFAVLLRGMKKKNVNFFSCHADGEWAGLLYVVNRKELSYIFYFAVDEAKRGRGIGTAVLKAAQKKYLLRKSITEKRIILMRKQHQTFFSADGRMSTPLSLQKRWRLLLKRLPPI